MMTPDTGSLDTGVITVVPLLTGTGSKNDCNTRRMLTVAGKVYSIILRERVMKITIDKVSEQQGGFRKGRGFVDHIFCIYNGGWEVLEERQNTVCSLMDLDKPLTGLTK